MEENIKNWHWRIGVAGIQIAAPRKGLVDIEDENRTTSTEQRLKTEVQKVGKNLWQRSIARQGDDEPSLAGALHYGHSPR